MISYLLMLVIFALISYMMTISNFQEIHIVGLIGFAFCLITFITIFIIWAISFVKKEKKDD